MAHEIKMGKDGILRAALVGNVEKADIDLFMKDLSPFLDASTEEIPLSLITDANRTGNYSSAARKVFTQFNHDHRIGKTAVVGANRTTRVLMHIVQRASKRDNIKLFDTEEAAIKWIKNGHQS